MTKVKKQIEEKKTEDAQGAVDAMREEIHALSMSHAKGQLKQTTQLRTKKDELARLLTQMNMTKFLDKKGDK